MFPFYALACMATYGIGHAVGYGRGLRQGLDEAMRQAADSLIFLRSQDFFGLEGVETLQIQARNQALDDAQDHLHELRRKVLEVYDDSGLSGDP